MAIEAFNSYWTDDQRNLRVWREKALLKGLEGDYVLRPVRTFLSRVAFVFQLIFQDLKPSPRMHIGMLPQPD
jgi:hypothetical protein